MSRGPWPTAAFKAEVWRHWQAGESCARAPGPGPREVFQNLPNDQWGLDARDHLHLAPRSLRNSGSRA